MACRCACMGVAINKSRAQKKNICQSCLVVYGKRCKFADVSPRNAHNRYILLLICYSLKVAMGFFVYYQQVTRYSIY